MESYASRIAKFQAEVEQLGQRSRLISNLRGLCFGSALILGIAAAAGGKPGVTGPVSLVLLFAFIGLVMFHAKVIEALDLAERWVDVNRDATHRLEHDWPSVLDNGEGLAPKDHLYAGDLDLFGRGSLFQRISVARTRFGRERLAELLLTAADPSEISRRQAAVRALVPELELRQRFEAHALGVTGTQRPRDGRSRVRVAPNPGPLLTWAESEPSLLRDPISVWGARLLPPITLLSVAATLYLHVSAAFFAGALLLQLLVIVRSQRETTRVFSAVSSTEGAFLRYGALLETIEQFSSEVPLLRELRNRLSTGAGAPSVAMARFRSIVGWFDLRHNAVYPVVNLFTLWDLHCTLALERWQQRAGKHLRDWFDVIGWFEALSSLASFAADEPNVTFPELSDAVCFEADSLSHPLLRASSRVANSVSLQHAGSALLVTGSNMSGKSTLLRAVGLAAVLAQAGAPVTARRLKLSRLAVATSIQVADSLEQGVSHFYAEITKLRRVVDAATSAGPVLFLLDEILHGTNSRERQLGARWVLAELIKKGSIGAISTHDQELCN
ncbi:MAG TPA: DNA mismatch repair protein MutS, partial [Polyangiaceae bacterium]|nr:DNA mismatch repair protein MutS [Polyangiaceae bacterium]